MDEDLIPLRNLGVDEGHELIDLIEGRSREILHADFLVLKAGVLDLKGVQTVALEAYDDGVPHLPQAGEIPLHESGAREAGGATPVDRVIEEFHRRKRATEADNETD